MFTVIALIVLFVNYFLDWSTLLNVSQDYGNELHSVFALLTPVFLAHDCPPFS